MSLEQRAGQAQSAAELFLPREEPHPAGPIIGLAAAGLGFWSASREAALAQTLAWIAIGGVLLGMLLHARWKRRDKGWRIDFARRCAEPVGLDGAPVTLEGAGWAIAIVPGDRRAEVAIDLRHEERGKVARLFTCPVRRRRDAVAMSTLADHLARRLDARREGPVL